MRVVSLVDLLTSRGFAGDRKAVVHGVEAGHVFDNRNRVRKRSYLQRVVSLRELLEAGVASFSSEQASAWYSYLLAKKRVPPESFSAKQFRLALAKSDGDAITYSLFARPALAPRAPLRLFVCLWPLTTWR